MHYINHYRENYNNTDNKYFHIVYRSNYIERYVLWFYSKYGCISWAECNTIASVLTILLHSQSRNFQNARIL